MLNRSTVAALVLFVGLLGLAAHAAPPSEEVSLTIRAFPQAQVYLDTPTGLSFLGKSDTPLQITPPMLRDPQGHPVQYASGVLVLKADSHADVRVTVSSQDWSKGVLPTSGVFALPAQTFFVSVKDYATTYPIAGVVLLVGLGLSAWQVRRWRRQARTASAQLETLSSQLDTAGDPLIGRNIGRYRVEARLGKGGMGAVYRVVDDGGAYAAKVMYLDTQEDPQMLDRFRREFKLLSQLKHPTFPRCFDYLEMDGMACAIMELVPGRTLRKHLDPDGLPWDVAWPWIKSILEGLEFAHEKGIVHRDLKPDNIMIADGQVKILDFGLARSSQVAAITMTGEALGTPRYLAPEQMSATSTDVDRRTDLYSLGILMYEMLSGAPPFQGEHADVIRMHMYEPAPRLEVAGVPETVADVIAVLLDKKPANRYASARRVLEVLEGAGSDTMAVDLDTIQVNRPPAE